MRLRRSAPAVLIAFLAAACGGGGSSAAKPGAASATCTPVEDEKAAKTVLRCTEDSIAFVETEIATGTGVVVAVAGKTFVLTNAHVVDPFDAADATLGTRTLEDLPVTGVDIAADIALLGPLTGKNLPKPLPIADGTALERGDDVFLVGYPGESDADDLDVTIASGIVSRLRNVAEFGQAYIQTDASIGGGQSGGPLFDGDGHLVGIAGLTFADEFALALSGRDAREAAAQIAAGKGDDDYVRLPVVGDSAGSTSGTARVADANDGQILYLPAADEARTWHLEIDRSGGAVATVSKFVDDELLALSGDTVQMQQAIAQQLAQAHGGRPEDLLDATAEGFDPKLAQREVAPGRFEIPIKADESALVVLVAPMTDGPRDIAWKSDLPLVAASKVVEEVRLGLGDKLDRVVGPFDTAIDVLADLEPGQRVELHARSPQGDPAVTVFRPGDVLDHLTLADPDAAGIETYDDTGDGLYGLDAKTAYDVEKAGTYRFRVYSNDMTSSVVRFTLVDCAKAKCGDKKEPATAEE